MVVSQNKTVVGLTGGIACGKSTALEAFRLLGWAVISADSLAHELLDSDPDVRKKIESRWGEKVVDASGSIDKLAIGRIVFSKVQERDWIEDLLHPIIRSKWLSFIQSCSSQKCMIELPLLFENKLQNNFSCTISLYAPKPVILKRLQKRGLSDEESECRISSQLSLYEKVEQADFVLWGGGDSHFLNQQAEQVDLLLS
jgi:dephospho-CoA kinase